MDFWDYLLWVFTFVGAAVMWGLQVDPEHTVSHAAKWAKTLFGVKNPPHWLRSESADRTIRHAAFALVAICLFLWAGKYFNVLSMSLGQKVLFFAGCTAVIGSIGWSLLLPLKSDGQVDTPASKVAVPNNAASMMSPELAELMSKKDTLWPLVKKYMDTHPGANLKSPEAIAFYNTELLRVGIGWRVTPANVDMLFGNVFVGVTAQGVQTGIKLDGASGNVFEQTEIHAWGTGVEIKNSENNRFKDTKINHLDPSKE